MLNVLKRIILSYINKLLPKYDRTFVHGFPNTESSAIAVANYVSRHYDMPVIYVIHSHQDDDPRPLLSADITTISLTNSKWHNVKNFYLTYLTSKYIFFTHGTPVDFFSTRQKVINIWHGVFYKNIVTLRGKPPIRADITVGTSQHTKKMFSEAFGVTEESVFVSGYPRNDLLLNGQKNKAKLLRSIDDLSSFKKIAIWMPTYRRTVVARDARVDGKELGNPFYIRDFDISYFDHLLNKNNTLCLVKPHPHAPSYENSDEFNNVRFIDNKWIAEQGLALYQLLGATDVLISDVSSVIIDYMLLDQPIICVSTDLKEYSNTRGFYFKNIKDWIPGPVIPNQEEFFDYLNTILEDESDPSRQEREKLKNYFFDDHDARSTERIVKYALKNIN